MEHENLFITRGGRPGKRNKAIASRNGKYYERRKHSDKRRRNKHEDLPKEITKSYFRLTRELEQLEEEYHRNLSLLCEEYDMMLEQQERVRKEALEEDERCREYDMMLEQAGRA